MRQKLSDADVKTRLEKLPKWTLDNGQITRTIEFATFPAAILFVAAVGHLAEAADHHPDMLITWRKVKFSLVTHDAGGLTENDFALAAKIDALSGQ